MAMIFTSQSFYVLANGIATSSNAKYVEIEEDEGEGITENLAEEPEEDTFDEENRTTLEEDSTSFGIENNGEDESEEKNVSEEFNKDESSDEDKSYDESEEGEEEVLDEESFDDDKINNEEEETSKELVIDEEGNLVEKDSSAETVAENIDESVNVDENSNKENITETSQQNEQIEIIETAETGNNKSDETTVTTNTENKKTLESIIGSSDDENIASVSYATEIVDDELDEIEKLKVIEATKSEVDKLSEEDVTVATTSVAELKMIDDGYGLGYVGSDYEAPFAKPKFRLFGDTPLPTSYDAREHGQIPAIRNQGSEGCCWAFSVIGLFEASALSKGYTTKDNINLSEAQLAYYIYNMKQWHEDNIQSNTHPENNDLPGLQGKDYCTVVPDDGDSFFSVGGNQSSATYMMSAYVGAVEEDENTAYNTTAMNKMVAHNIDGKYAFNSNRY